MEVSKFISTDQPVKGNQIHNLFASLNSFSTFLLVSSILTYIFSPILGCVFILLFLQIKISKRFNSSSISRSGGLPKNIELFLILLVLFAITIYGSTFQVEKGYDLYHSINTYNKLQGTGINGLFSLHEGKIDSREIEPVTFVIPQLMGMLFGYHDNYFILIQSFTFNLILTTFAYVFFPFLYPIIILINITSGSGLTGTSAYFYHMFLMRQFYSHIFILAMAFTPSFIINLIFFLLSLLTHKSSAIFSLPLFLLSILSLPRDMALIPTKFKITRIFLFISKFLMNRKLIILFLTFLISFSLFPKFLQIYTESLDSNDLYQFYVYDTDSTMHGNFSLVKPDWIVSNILPEIFLFLFSTLYLRNSISFYLSPRKYTAQISFFIISVISVSLLLTAFLTDLNHIFLRPISTIIATKGFLYGLIIETLYFSRANSKTLSKYITVLVVILISFSLGTWFYRNLVGSYYFFFRLSSGSLRGYVTNLNDIPTLANNLFDYFNHFVQLVFP